MPQYEFIDNRSTGRLSGMLGDAESVGLDTEFMRERTYFPELCLLQVATREQILCVDPLDVPDPAGLWPPLLGRRWIVHSGRQDIEVIYQAAGAMPRDLFDTQVAAALLGFAPQLGYASLVAELFGVELAKSHTRANWARRPLPEEFVEYAAEDVEYLLPANDELGARLDKLGRLTWAEEDSRELLQPSLYESEPAEAVQRLKGARNLRGRARSAAANLAEWREAEALSRNRPRQWILSDATLLEIAVTGPNDRAALARVRGMPERLLRRSGDLLLELLRRPNPAAEAYEPGRRPDAEDKARLAEVQRIVADVARDLGVAPEILAARKELSRAVQGCRDLRVFRGWRRELVGAALLEKLEG